MSFLRTPSLEQLDEHPPVILIGMHRSGTSLLCRLLERLGVHMGADPDLHSESMHFRALNAHALQAANARWDMPAPLLDALRDPAFVVAQAGVFRARVLNGLDSVRYWGWPLWWRLRCGAPLPPWAWKDPRTSLTLPIWLDVFPRARVVHIIRNGIDVAISLHRREKAKFEARRGRTGHSNPLAHDFHACFNLWEIYQAHLLTYRETIPAALYTEIRYETLLREPEVTLRHVLDRIDVPVNEADLAPAVATINTGRLDNRAHAAAYQDIIPDLVENPLMRALGYPEE